MRADARLKRSQIIQAGMAQFRSRPASSVTLEAVAADAGVGIATLYRHFPSRASLRQACALGFVDALDELLAATLQDFDADPEGKWEAFVCTLAEYGVGMLVEALVSELPVDAGGEAVDPEVLAARDRFLADVQVLVDKAAGHGLVDPALTPIDLASELIVVTRPADPKFSALFPDVRNRLVRHLLLAWRAAGTQAAHTAHTARSAQAARP